MNKFLFVLAAATTLTLLSACADEGYYAGGGYRYSYNDGYYDNYYGPIYSGYWGPDTYFYYSTGVGHPFIRDDNRHFRREAYRGYHHFRVPDRRMEHSH